MGRTRGKYGVSQIGDASDIMEVERAQDWENALMAWNTPLQGKKGYNDMLLEAEGGTHVYCTSGCYGEASPLTPR
jgi:hypothetical protein